MVAFIMNERFPWRNECSLYCVLTYDNNYTDYVQNSCIRPEHCVHTTIRADREAGRLFAYVWSHWNDGKKVSQINTSELLSPTSSALIPCIVCAGSAHWNENLLTHTQLLSLRRITSWMGSVDTRCKLKSALCPVERLFSKTFRGSHLDTEYSPNQNLSIVW